MSAPHARSGTNTPTRLHSAVFRPIGDEGRSELVERRIAEAIQSGVLVADEQLPPEADLAKSLGVAPVTAREALNALRERGLIVTKRGRSGGSFVAEGADPAQFARESLQQQSRLAIRDLLAHFAAVAGSCAALAATRAAESEIEMLRSRILHAEEVDSVTRRRIYDDAQIELSALSQSPRLSREHMRVQAELSPYLTLIDENPDDRERLARAFSAMIDALASGDPSNARAAVETMSGIIASALIRLQSAS
ncbi:FadR/GntR family transcriptional regulator [Humidisolicoccus flavus]|uniref:FadR/GntR family transcriptional regulator n=1 Tax=Humidisolicoccus flavus TaxID=3111414 RepID=UPI0032546E2B